MRYHVRSPTLVSSNTVIGVYRLIDLASAAGASPAVADGFAAYTIQPNGLSGVAVERDALKRRRPDRCEYRLALTYSPLLI